MTVRRIVGTWLGYDVVLDPSLPPDKAQLVHHVTGTVRAVVPIASKGHNRWE